MAKTILALIVVAAGHLCYGDERCDGESFRACESNVDNALKGLDGVLPDDDFLDEHCEGLISKLGCVDAAQQSCLNTDTTPSDLQMLKDYVQELCDKNSELRKGFITSGTCLNSHREDLRRRVQDAMKTMMAFRNTHDLDYTKPIPESNSLMCLGMDFAMSAMQDAAEEYCGREAKKIITDIVELLIVNLPDNPCDETDESYQHYKNLLEEFISS